MRRDLGLLEIDRVVFHRVAKRLPRHQRDDSRLKDGGEVPEVEYSETDTPLDSATKNYFTERIQKSLKTRRAYTAFDSVSQSPVPGLIHEFLCVNPDSLIECSKQVADHLWRSQNGINPAGLVMVAQARIEDIPAIAILKLEEESGIRMQRDSVDGLPTFKVVRIDDLTMPESAKVLKTGFFIREGESMDDIEGHVSDMQYLGTDESGVAHFFFSTFLGCKLREDAAVLTSRAYDAAMQWVDDTEFEEISQRASCIDLLNVTFRQNTGNIENLEEVVARSLDADLSDSFIEHMEGQGLNGLSVPMDNSLIGRHLKNAVWEFESGIRVFYPPGTFSIHIQVEDGEEGETVLRIVDRTKKVKRQ